MCLLLPLCYSLFILISFEEVLLQFYVCWDFAIRLCFSYYAILSILSSFGIILLRKRALVALLLLSSWCIVTVSDLWFFLNMPWVGLQCW